MPEDHARDYTAATRPAPTGGDSDQASLGDLTREITQDLSRLIRQEITLAKAEIRQEAREAGMSAGLLGGAGFAGYMVAIVGSFAAVFAIAYLIGLAWAAFAITVGWALVASVLAVLGRRRLRRVSPKPEQTIETVKEDAQWLRHPTK